MPLLFDFLVLFIPNYENLLYVDLGLEPLTIRIVASLANHYINMTY
jgi:hypothetical protein